METASTTEPGAVRDARAILHRLDNYGPDDTARDLGFDEPRHPQAFLMGYLKGSLRSLLAAYDQAVKP